MAKLTAIFMAMVLAIAALPAFAKDTTYRDPRNPSFGLLVPDGWTASKTDSGVNLNHGSSSVILFIVTGSRPPADMVADLTAQFQKQAKNFRPMDKGECRFGGQKGAYAEFSGIGPNGTAEVTRIVSMTNGQLVYSMILQAHPDQYEDEKRDFQRIEESLAPDPIATSVDDREKLDALYAAGVINQQEYEARKKNLGSTTSAATTPPSATTPDSGGNSSGASSNPRAQKQAALDQAYRAGVLTKEEYETKSREIEAQGNAAAATAAVPGGSHGGGDNRFHAPDGSYSTVLPAGWTSQRMGSGAQATDTFFPSDGGQERILISAMPATLNLQQVVTGMATTVTTMFPALRLARTPAYGQIDGNPAAELHYQGALANGAKISAWQGVRLIAGKYYSVFSVAQMDRAAAVEADAETMFRNLRPERTR
jgi:Short C-terminal domain